MSDSEAGGFAGCRPARGRMNRPLYAVVSAASFADLAPLVIHSHFHAGGRRREEGGGGRSRGEMRKQDAQVDKEASFL